MATKERASKVFVRLDIYTPKHTRFIKVRLLFCSDRFIVKTLQTEHPPKGPGWMKCPLCRGYQLRGLVCLFKERFTWYGKWYSFRRVAWFIRLLHLRIYTFMVWVGTLVIFSNEDISNFDVLVLNCTSFFF